MILFFLNKNEAIFRNLFHGEILNFQAQKCVSEWWVAIKKRAAIFLPKKWRRKPSAVSKGYGGTSKASPPCPPWLYAKVECWHSRSSLQRRSLFFISSQKNEESLSAKDFPSAISLPEMQREQGIFSLLCSHNAGKKIFLKNTVVFHFLLIKFNRGSLRKCRRFPFAEYFRKLPERYFPNGSRRHHCAAQTR